jgi:hypothetical protein
MWMRSFSEWKCLCSGQGGQWQHRRIHGALLTFGKRDVENHSLSDHGRSAGLNFRAMMLGSAGNGINDGSNVRERILRSRGT